MNFLKKIALVLALVLGMTLTSNANTIQGQIQECGYNAYGTYVCDWAYDVSVQLFTYDGSQYYVASTVGYTSLTGWYYFYNVTPGTTYYLLVGGSYYKKIYVDYADVDTFPVLTANL